MELAVCIHSCRLYNSQSILGTEYSLILFFFFFFFFFILACGTEKGKKWEMDASGLGPCKLMQEWAVFKSPEPEEQPADREPRSQSNGERCLSRRSELGLANVMLSSAGDCGATS